MPEKDINEKDAKAGDFQAGKSMLQPDQLKVLKERTNLKLQPKVKEQFHYELERTTRFVSDLARSLQVGRVEHELRPSAQLLTSELSGVLSNRELELLKKGFLLTRTRPHGQNIQGVITALLKDSFDELDFSDSGNPSDSQARLLGILRDLGLELATFLERSESDGVTELQELLHECQIKFQERAQRMHLPAMALQVARVFLVKVAAAIFFDKLELILQDYLASGTDYSLVSGKVWASRYSRADYMPFLFDSIAALQKQKAWLFEDSEAISKIASIQVQVKAASLKTDFQIKQLSIHESKSLEAVLLEMRAFFGIGLNCLVKNEAELALRFFERVLTCSADALEHNELKSNELAQRLSRIRVQAYLCCARAEIKESASKLLRSEQQVRIKSAPIVYEQKRKSISKIVSKIKYELELLGLSGLAIDIDGESHSSIDGLSEWVNQIVSREETLLLSELANVLGLLEGSHTQLCSYLAILLEFESWEGQRFSELASVIRVETKTGKETQRIWRTQKLKAHDERFVTEICERVASLPARNRERFIKSVPLSIALCLEFQDFDLGFGLAVAHRHLFRQIIIAAGSSPDLELLYSMIDAEIGFKFSLFGNESKSPQNAALALLAQNRDKEQKGYFREIDRRRETRLLQSVDNLSKIEALSELSNFRESQIIREGIHGQFASEEIRMMTAVARASKKKYFAKELSSLVLARIDQRLRLNERQVDDFINLDVNEKSGTSEAEAFLQRLDIQSRALVAVQVLLDVSLTCAILHEENTSRSLLLECNVRYSKIFPGLVGIIDTILAAKSLEEFRRRVEAAIKSLQQEALDGGLSIIGNRSGAELGFKITKNNLSLLSELFDCFFYASSIARRRIVPGRCRPLQRYVIAHNWAHLQNHVLSCIVALNEGLENIDYKATENSAFIKSKAV